MLTSERIFNNFMVNLPKELLLPPYNESKDYDYSLIIGADYEYNEQDKFTIFEVHCTFSTAKCINWELPELNEYLLEAAKNNFSSLFNIH